MIFMSIVLTVLLSKTNGQNMTTKSLNENKYHLTNRSARIYFPIFEMIEFPNEGCMTVDGLMGTCYARTECLLFNGISRGFCARGFGVCCFFKANCGDIMFRNRTHLLNPNFPHAFNGEMLCDTTIKTPIDACQVRLHFVQFLISNPKDKLCTVDSLTIPHSYKIPILCGNLTGQHIYLEAKGIQELKLKIATGSHPMNRYWIIEVQFIQCDLLLKAPSGCLQYYTGIDGVIKTFNFDCVRRRQLPTRCRSNKVINTFNSVNNTGSGNCLQQHEFIDRSHECLIGDLEYNICIRIEWQRCAIEWRANHFDMGPNGLFGGQRGDFCQQNYITIENAKSLKDFTNSEVNKQIAIKSFDRFCGSALNIDRFNTTSSPLISTVKPFQLGVTTSHHFVGRLRGASLSYHQKVCVGNA